MASGNSPRLGNSTVSALLRSANSRMVALENLQDEQMAYDYARSGYTDEAFSQYAQYLNNRIKALSGRPDVTSASKALTLTKTLDSANKSNLSAQITRENIQMMTGNSSTSDKLALVVRQAQTAQSIGDLTLYQHLEEQAYSLSQQVQKEQTDAMVASSTLAQVNSTLGQLGFAGRASNVTGSSNNSNWVQQIKAAAQKYGVDPQAALAVASAEGLGGGVGDNGTSFGPFQLHVGGALPAGKDRAWAESPAGIDYALRTIAGVAKGLTGQAAVEAIVTKFERPANPTGEIQRAMAAYGGNFTGGAIGPSGPLTAAQVRIASGNFTLQDLADAGMDQVKALQQGYVSAANTLQDKLKQFNDDFAKIGKNGQQKAIDNWVKQVTPALNQLGVTLPVGAKPNYGDLLQGVYLGLNKIYQNASIAASAFDPGKADEYATKANEFATGQATIPTNVKGIKGGNLDMNLFDLKDLAYSLANPGTTARFMATSNGAAVEKPQGGLRYGDLGGGQGLGVAPAYLPNPFSAPNSKENYAFVQSKDDPNSYQSAPQDLTKTLNGLHLQYQGKSANQGDTALVTDASPDYIKKIAKPGSVLQVYMSPLGLQFSATPTGGFSGNSVYTVGLDGAGRKALYEEGPNGSRLIGADNGYNNRKSGDYTSGNFKDAHGFLGHLVAALHPNFSFANMFGNAGTHQLISDASTRAYAIQQQQIAEANRQAALAMLQAKQTPLPNISQPSPAPLPNISIYKPPTLSPIPTNTRAVTPTYPTYNPQPAPSYPVQQPAPINLQGGSYNLLTSGGGGIRL